MKGSGSGVDVRSGVVGVALLSGVDSGGIDGISDACSEVSGEPSTTGSVGFTVHAARARKIIIIKSQILIMLIVTFSF